MKIYKMPASKLVDRFDNELKNMLREDLRSFKANNNVRSINKQVTAQHPLSAA